EAHNLVNGFQFNQNGGKPILLRLLTHFHLHLVPQKTSTRKESGSSRHQEN
ncbi:hypothetical protein S245_071760, partial [Arachis hypogaea]